MFEGLVQNLLLGYLGSYINNIQKDQLKIGPWSGEVKLNDLELNLEAFDNLQLPFSLNQGRVGTLSIKIPWKKLGWDPIEISLDKVFICACERDEHEWSVDSVGKREYATKKAKLHAAEMAKPFVSEAKTWQSFLPHITAKILDGIQVSITDVRFIFTNKQSGTAPFLFGLRFSSLKLERNNVRSYSGKLRGGEVNKSMVISCLEIYCNACQGTTDDISEFAILEPCDVTVSLMVNKSGQLDGSVPQYSVNVELTSLVLQINEIQMHQLLMLSDYLGTCHLREKYGRFRPSSSTLFSKPVGWQKLWWHYVQESVLLDIRKKLRKTSWRYLGWRISYRRKYVNLYKEKLNFIRQAQPMDKDILLELEQMEKDSDIDDILTYRSIAERESQEILGSLTLPSLGKYSGNAAAGVQQIDENSLLGSRGWINWLSLGMLGAGGVDNSSQFSGVVSDEIVKDIYEVTQFHPLSSVEGCALTKNGIFLFSIKFNVQQINATLLSKKYDQETVKVVLDEVNIIFKLWEESWNVLMFVKSVEMDDLCTGSVILLTKAGSIEENFLTLEVDMSSANHEPESTVKAVFEPFEFTYGSEFLLNLWDFFDVWGTFQFHSKRVLASLNGFDNENVRIMSKAEYIFLNRTNIIWDVRFSTFAIKIPWLHENSQHIMVLELGSLKFRSSNENNSYESMSRDQHTTSSISYSDKSLGVKVGDLYDHFETELANFKVNVVQPDCNKVISIIDRCGASFTLASCIIPDESVLEQLKVHILVSSLCLHFSPSIYGALLEMSSRMDMSKEKSEPVIKQPHASFGIGVELKCVNFHVNLADKDEENSSALTLALCEVYILYSYQEDVDWRLSVKTLEISSCGSIGEGSNHLLCSSRNSVHQSSSGVGIEIASNGFGESSATDGKCFVLHCQAQKSIATDRQEYNIDFNGLDLHIYPNIVGMLLRFFDRLSGYVTPAPSCKNSFDPNSAIKDKLCLRDKSMSSCFELKKFGFSNFCDDGPTTSDGIPFDHFPFVTIQNSGSLSSLIQSLLHGCTQWNPVVPRQRKCGRCLGSCFKNRQGMTGGNLKSLPDTNFYPPSKDSRAVAVNVFDLNLNGINVYFHDTSCLLGTLTLPFCKSLFVTQGEICLDILCSVDGLELSSAWATKNFGEFLWGYSVPNLSPVLNIRFRKNGDWTLNPNFEISFSVQHVCCILPPEFLAILIGYFTMPAWSSRGYENSRTENHKQSQNENPTIIWKVEILNSRLIIPVECNKRESLHLGLQQLYFSFTTANDKDVALKDIPLDCMVPSQKVVNCVHLLNIFGRNACLSLALLKNEGRVSERLDHDTSHENFSIISSLDIDLWIRLPCDNMPFGGPAGSTCIMSKVDNCQVIAEDEVFLIGVEALLNVIDDFSKVGREAEGFRSDIFHFVQFKKTLRESNVVTADTPYPTFKDIRFNVHSLSLLLYQSRQKESGVSELVTQADMQFQVSASFKDDVPLCLDVVFSGLVLNSLHSSVILVQCSSDVSNASVFHIHLAKSHRGVNILVVDMPSVHIWLHLSDWSNVIGLLVSYSEQFAKSSFMNPSPNHLISATSEMASIETIHVHQSDLESTRGSDITFYTNTENSFDLIIRSENLCVSLHYPLLVDAETLDKSREAESDLGMLRDCSSDILGEAVMLKGRHRQYVTLALHIREYELSFSSGHANLICCVEEARGVLDNVKDQRVFSSSFFQLFQVNVVVECDKQQTQRVNADIRIDSMDVSVSHQLFHIWYSLGYQDPEAGSSTYSFFNMDIKLHLRKVSLLLTDWTCSCNGPILEILLKNLVLHSDTTERSVQASIASDLLVNYFNTHKVVWEPFIETWNFLLSISRIHKQSFPLKTSSVTDIHLTSTSHLNMNITEPIVEVIFRANELIKRVQCPAGLTDPQEVHNFVGSQSSDGLYAKRYAPYTLQNETSLPFLFQLHRGLVNQDEVEILSVKEGNVVYPGSSVPIYTDETPEEQFLRFRPPQSSDRLNEKKSFGVAHHFISIQLDGTCGPSRPISVDIVGLTHFEVNFSKALPKEAVEANDDVLNSIKKSEEHGKIDPNSGFVVPVVFDVSTLHYRKLIRVYSTVMLLNTTSMTLELQFDTPFGVSPKAQYQIASGEEFPLPLHLAEAGRMRWRPFKSSFLWSEAHTFSKVLSQETKLGYFRSFICYPSFPSGDSFHCCLSIQLINLASASGQLNSSPFRMKETLRQSVGNSVQSVYSQQHSKTQFLHYVTLTTPLLVRNYMPRELSLTIESRGDARTVLIPEVNCASIFHIDSSHDLGLVFHVDGFSNSTSKFPCAEAFVTVARFHENKFSQSETLTFYPDSSKGPIYVTLEKTMDGLCGARELCIFVPFLLYNCTGLHITVADMGHEMEGCTMPPCDHLIEMDQYIGRRQSPILLSSKHDSYSTTSNIDSIWNVSSKNQSISLKEHANHHSGRFSRRNFINVDPSAGFFDHSGNNHHDFGGASSNKERRNTPSLMGISKEGVHGSSYIDVESKRVKPCMYFPHSSSSASELMVRLSICLPKFFTDNEKSPVWSSPFYLIPASGSSCVVVPQADTSGAFIVSVTSSLLSGPFSGRTRAITFQPRYLISNACSKDLCYKQKGSDLVFHLGVGQHSHLHWADPSRELLVSLVFNEPGWLWSGSFFPDHLGDTQVKMRNYEHGSLSMIRVEVQNADAIITDEKVGIPNGNSGTVLILLSDDNSGFMPYRIDNFSNERLRIYQENCKTFETTIHSYMSCLYTWDEPCSLHCLVVEVLGERILGSFALDDVTEQVPVYLPSTSEKPARQLYLSIHADGAVKVLSIVDSSYLPKDMDSGFCGIKEKRRYDQKEEIFVDCCESVSVHIPFIGVSLIDAYPQELLFASAIDTRIDLLQSVQQQKVSFQISSLQVDNQLHNTVLLSLDHDRGSNLADQVKNEGTKRMKDGFILDVASQNSCQPVISFSALKWRNKDISFVCFDYIILRLAALRLELEEEVILCLFDFMRSVSKMQSGALPCLESTSRTVVNSTQSLKGLFVHTPHYASFNLYRGQSFPMSISKYLERCGSHPSLPSVVPIEDFWEQIYLVERKHNRIFVEVFILAPIKLTLSFSSAPWVLRDTGPTAVEYPRSISGSAFQRGLMALADVEGAPVYLKQLTIAHHMGTTESFNEILIRHYTPQLLHEMYKIFGSASVIGNPMGFAKNLGLGIKDFISVPATGILKSPSGLFTGVAHGTTSLFYRTVYATSNAATQFSKSVHKSIVALTFDDQAISTMEKQWTSLASHSTGVLHEFLEGLTGFLQSPIRGAEKHGLPGVFTGIVLGTAGLVTRPVASILEVTGKTAQSIRNRSILHESRRHPVRPRRLLNGKQPLQPYIEEEEIGKSILLKVDDVKFKEEIFVTCRELKKISKFLILTERFVLIAPDIRIIPNQQCVIEFEMSLKNVIYIGKEGMKLIIVGINSETPLKQHHPKISIRTNWWSQATPLPLFQMKSIELDTEEEAEYVLRVLVSVTEQRSQQSYGVHVLHRSNLS